MDIHRSTRRGFLGTAAVCAGSVACGGGEVRGAARAGLYEYPKPAFKKGSTILFQGDSITHGGRGRDPNHYMGHSYAYLVAARLGADMPQQDLRFLNRGVSGNTVKSLQARWQKDALDLKPDVLSILIGVNGRYRFSAEEYAKTYKGLLEQTIAALGGITLVLIDPFVNPREKPESRARIEVDKRRAIVKELAKTFKAIHVPTQEMFDEAAKGCTPNYWIWDGVHPMPAGHELLARKWVETVAAHLRK